MAHVSCLAGTVPGGPHPTQEQWARKMCQGPAERSQQGCSMPANCEGQHQRTVFGEEQHRQPPAHCLPPTCRHRGTDSAITPGTQPSPRAATCNAGLTLRLCLQPPPLRTESFIFHLTLGKQQQCRWAAGRQLFCPCIALDGAEHAAHTTQGYIYNRDSILVSLAITASYY